MTKNFLKISLFCLVSFCAYHAAIEGETDRCRKDLFTMRLAGDPTEELKRRITFLFEDGKIGKTNLERMVASKTPISPFVLEPHIPSNLMPHEKAIQTLLATNALDWNDVQAFVSKIKRKAR